MPLACRVVLLRKWIKRLQSASPEDEQVWRGLWRALKHPPEPLDAQVIDRILEICDQPPEELGRPPGPKAILFPESIPGVGRGDQGESGCIPTPIHQSLMAFRSLSSLELSNGLRFSQHVDNTPF